LDFFSLKNRDDEILATSVGLNLQVALYCTIYNKK